MTVEHDPEKLFNSTLLPLYRAVEEQILSVYPAIVDVKKTQVSFRAGLCFAWVWLPIRPMKGRPEHYVILTLALGRPVKDPKILELLEPFPGRWTHHILIQRTEDVDTEIIGWIREAIAFAQFRAEKRNRRIPS